MILFSFISLALIAFAANSVLCRMALGSDSIDPVSFTSIRLIGGAIALTVIYLFTKEPKQKKEASCNCYIDWYTGIALYIYAFAFSLAYISLSSGTGALILFGSVQITMLIAATKRGEKMRFYQWIGFLIAVAGIVYLVSPGISAPDIYGASLMIVSGIAWGVYSIAGKSVTNPISATKGNFIKASIIAIPVSMIALKSYQATPLGLSLALISGVITSGLGYVIWYKVVPLITTTQAAVLQLLVPLLAAIGGVLFIAEDFTLRLAISSLLILGGVILSVLTKKKSLPTPLNSK